MQRENEQWQVVVETPSRHWQVRLFMFAAALVASPLVTLRAQPSKIPLSDDASRAQLFELMGQIIEARTPPSDFTQFAFRASFRFPHDAQWRDPVLNQDPRNDQLFGIDVSHHTTDTCHCTINWLTLADQKISFAYLKATQGTNYYDPSFETNISAIHSLPTESRIEVGAFHFLSANGTPEEQAANFLDVINGKSGRNDLAPALDVEWDVRTGGDGKLVLDADGKPKDFWADTPGNVILDHVHAWLKLVEAGTHKKPIVYTNQTWWNQRIGTAVPIEQSLLQYRVWISDLSSKGLKVELPYTYKGAWLLWQFSFTATADGGGLPPGHTVDVDVFSGTHETLLNSLR